jgi:hypothetical protein
MNAGMGNNGSGRAWVQGIDMGYMLDNNKYMLS